MLGDLAWMIQWSWRQSSGNHVRHVEEPFTRTDAQEPSGREVREEGQQKTAREEDGDPGGHGVVGGGRRALLERIMQTSQFCVFLSG